MKSIRVLFGIMAVSAMAMMVSPARAGENPVSFHGYGEMHFNDPKTSSSVPDGDAPARMDFHRMVWGLSYHFNDRFSLHTEIDFEHAANELELELAYLDYLINPLINLRAGSVLMPVGALNETHEPTLFYSVERPYVQAYIIPTTWMEGGAGIFGGFLDGFKYRAYLVNGLDASGFSASSGLRGGRSKVNNAPSEDFAGVGRLEYVGIPGFQAGVSGYYGKADHDDKTLDDIGVTIFSGDLRYQFMGADLRGSYTQVRVSNAENILTESCSLQAPAGGGAVTESCSSSPAGVGEKMVGWYVEGAYDLLRPFQVDTQRLMAFVRLENFNTQDEVPSAYSADPKNERQIITFGVAYYPHPDIAIKIDEELWEDEADNEGERLNVGIAYMF